MEYPKMITDLPEADIPFEGIRGWLMQTTTQQLVFMELDPIGGVPEHSHSAQFGVVLEGEMTLTVGGESTRYKKGDSYAIPAGVPHSAEVHSHVKVIDMFDEVARFSVK